MDDDFTYQIDDFGSELSTDEQAMLVELDEKKMIVVPGRTVEGRTDQQADSDRRRIKMLKTLVYRDLASFTIGEPKHYVFASRSVLGRF